MTHETRPPTFFTFTVLALALCSACGAGVENEGFNDSDVGESEVGEGDSDALIDAYTGGFVEPKNTASIATTNLFSSLRVETPLYLSDANGLSDTELYSVSLDPDALEAERSHLATLTGFPSIDIAIDPRTKIIFGVEATDGSRCDEAHEMEDCGRIICYDPNSATPGPFEIGHTSVARTASAGIYDGELYFTARTTYALYNVSVPTNCTGSTALPTEANGTVTLDVRPLELDGAPFDVSSSDMVFDVAGNLWTFTNSVEHYGLYKIASSSLAGPGPIALSWIGPVDPANAPTGPITGLAFVYEGGEQLVGSQRGADDAVVAIDTSNGEVTTVYELVEGGVGVQQNGGGMAGLIPEMDTRPCENGSRLSYWGNALCGLFIPGADAGSFTQFVGSNKPIWVLDDTDYINVRITGTIEAPGWNSYWEGGYPPNSKFGLVFGHRDTTCTAAGDCEIDTFLFSWGRKWTHFDGWQVAHIDTNGVPQTHNDPSFWTWLPLGGAVDWKQEVSGAASIWGTGTYDFELVYTEQGATLKVWPSGSPASPAVDATVCTDDAPILPGAFGLYSHSAKDVVFRDLAVESIAPVTPASCAP